MHIRFFSCYLCDVIVRLAHRRMIVYGTVYERVRNPHVFQFFSTGNHNVSRRKYEYGYRHAVRDVLHIDCRITLGIVNGHDTMIVVQYPV